MIYNELNSNEKWNNVEVHNSVLIRKVPEVGKFNAYGAKNIKYFFKEFYNYCRVSYPEIKIIR